MLSSINSRVFVVVVVVFQFLIIFFLHFFVVCCCDLEGKVIPTELQKDAGQLWKKMKFDDSEREGKMSGTKARRA